VLLVVDDNVDIDEFAKVKLVNNKGNKSAIELNHLGHVLHDGSSQSLASIWLQQNVDKRRVNLIKVLWIA
jgi:hypothetical protein